MFILTRKLAKRVRTCVNDPMAAQDDISPLPSPGVRRKGSMTRHTEQGFMLSGSRLHNGGARPPPSPHHAGEGSTGGLTLTVPRLTLRRPSPPSLTTLNTHAFSPRMRNDKCRCCISGIALTDNADLIVGDAANHSVKVIDPQGHFRAECTMLQTLGAIVDPSGVAATRGGQIVVSDRVTRDIKLFNSDGRLFNTFGHGLSRVNQVFVDEEDTVYVTDEGRGRVQLYRVFGERGSVNFKPPHQAGGRAFAPYGIAQNSHGLVVVSDCVTGALVMYDRQGQLMKVTAGCGLSKPHGLLFDAADRLLVVDRGHQRLVHFDLDRGRVVTSVLTGLTEPVQVVHDHGNKYAVLEDQASVVQLVSGDVSGDGPQ